MDTVSKIIAYLCIWIIVFFMSLPVGVKTEKPVTFGHANSAPDHPRVLLKLVVSSVIALAIFLAAILIAAWLKIEL